MARILKAQGEKIALLALLNSCPPNSSYTRVRFGVQFIWRFFVNLTQWLFNSLKWTPSQRWGFLQWKWRLLGKQLFGANPDEENGEIDEWVDLSPFPDDQKKLWETHLRSLMKFHPKPYAGHVTL